MDQKTLVTLEFDKVLQKISSFAVLDRTKRLLLDTLPFTELPFAVNALDKTEEADRLLYRYGVGGIEYFDDIDGELDRAEIGATLSCAELLRVARLLRSSRSARAAMGKDGMDDVPLLAEIAQKLHPDSMLENEIFSKILSEDLVSDNASEKLASLRRAIKNTNAKIREKFNSYIRGSLSKYLQDAIVTKRGDRYVIPVRQEHRGQIRGLIHDQSSSGQTLFIEPEQVLEMNNELKTLQLEESVEIDRILSELSVAVGRISERLRWNIDLLVELDTCYAKATYSYKNRCSRPKLNAQGVVDLVKARHPLISPEKVVPITAKLGENYRYLLISGPNTGGKTVTLKLVGLCALMAMCGIFIPANEGSAISIYDDIFCDIGDDQSIEQSLSTFSSHMKNIIRITENVNQKSLVLIDEIGAGTDPEEGAALALGVIQKLLDVRSTGIITTHYSSLKEFAFSDDRICNASMEFDAATYSPLFRLNIGVPGSSNAIEISKKLGLASEIAENAVGFLSDRKINFDTVLKRAEQTRLAAERERDELTKLLAEQKIALKEAQMERAELAAAKNKLLAGAKVESRRLVSERMEEAEELVAKIKKILEKDELDGGDLIAARTLKNKLENQKFRLESEPDRTLPRTLVTRETLKVGQKIYIKSTDSCGVVEKISAKKPEAEVRIGTIRMNAKFSDLYLEAEMVQPQNKPKSPILGVKITRKAEISQPQREINVIGKNAVEAQVEVEAFLDAAVMDKLEEIKIIHGVGHGILRGVVRDILKGHPAVKDFRLGVFGEGEKGVTIVTLK